MQSGELTTETLELSKGMLRIIGAYGMHSGAEVPDLYLKGALQSSPPERTLASADTDTSEDVPPTANGW